MAAVTPQAPQVPVPPVPFGGTIRRGVEGGIQSGDIFGIGHALGNASGIVSGTEQGVEKIGQIAVDLTNPDFWVRIGEFTVGAILLTVGLSKMFSAGQHARGVARTAERSSRVAYSVTPTGSAVNRGARSVARTARRSRA